MSIKGLSPKQAMAVTWWNKPETKDFDVIICDGAVRSGKTLSMSLGFIIWAMSEFSGGSFALCGKTVTSLKRNLVTPLIPEIKKLGYFIEDKPSKGYFDVMKGKVSNRFYCFGGKDESSAALIQGITLCGVLLDEAALMPRSFAEQAIARCSVKNSRIWFSCNPSHPYHWFYREWIMKAREKNTLYLHFTMEDNPSLSEKIKVRYRRLYSGSFYDRFILGKWVSASGVVYPMFDGKKHVFEVPPKCERFMVSCDYGTVNPCSMGLWGYSSGKWYRLSEYYYSSREKGLLRTDEEHYSALEKLTMGYSVEAVIADPSAASFMECIRRHGRFRVIPAKNDVIGGIRRVSDRLRDGTLMFSESCRDTLREFSQYVWSEKDGADVPQKENDHAMDDIRYFVNTVLAEEEAEGFFVAAVRR